jgi:hypothetical protein
MSSAFLSYASRATSSKVQGGTLAQLGDFDKLQFTSLFNNILNQTPCFISTAYYN